MVNIKKMIHHLVKHSWLMKVWLVQFCWVCQSCSPNGGVAKAMISLTLAGLIGLVYSSRIPQKLQRRCVFDDIDNTDVTEVFFRKMGAVPTTKRLIPTVYSLDQYIIIVFLQNVTSLSFQGKPVPCCRDRSLSSADARLLMNNTVGVVVDML